MKVSIITEGFQNTGYGHITRCLSLYQAFEERNIIPTFFINGDEQAKKYLGDSNYKLISWLTHPTKLISEINGSDILIIDSYHAGKEYYETLSKLSKISLFLDDYMRLDYPAGIILNGTMNSETFPYKKNPASQFLLGAKYIPIRKEFWNPPVRKINQTISSILITYGGQDIRGLTIPTYKSILNNFPQVKKTLVVGNGDAGKREFEKLKDDWTEVFYSIDAAKMFELMLSSDITISAAGQTLYELAVTGTPTIAVAVADNQRNNILEWKKNGFLIDPIFHGDSNHQKKIIEQLSAMQSVSLRKKLCAKGKSSVDGQGSRRVIEILLNKLY
jgi:UDP-2,4-diacetamido-2,4,6-trideoxy-beta-L-altropyranose hydrolase